jgi:quinolinate synthase
LVFAASQATANGVREGRPAAAELPAAIRALKHQRKAVILAHYYQEGAIQDIADFIGDSLELSRQAAGTDAEVIVFCGVHFMAETAKILSPAKTVLIPDLDAGCSLADACPADAFASFRAEHPDHITVSYINDYNNPAVAGGDRNVFIDRFTVTGPLGMGTGTSRAVAAKRRSRSRRSTGRRRRGGGSGR